MVIFGATGDLTHRKLVPALYNLAADGALPPAVSVVGFARRDEVEEAWKFVDAIRAEWDKNSDDLALYAAGTWGPTEADELIERYGAAWRRL
jgi:glucose-6-phosphate 1-dehydrogenase